MSDIVTTTGIVALGLLALFGLFSALAVSIDALGSLRPVTHARLATWWRKWSPWILRRHIEVYAHDASPNTTTELQDQRYFEAALRGDPDPGEEGRRWRMEDGIARFNATDRTWAQLDHEREERRRYDEWMRSENGA